MTQRHCLALYQHSCHEVQSSYNALSVQELQLRPAVGLMPQQGIKFPLCHIGYSLCGRIFIASPSTDFTILIVTPLQETLFVMVTLSHRHSTTLPLVTEMLVEGLFRLRTRTDPTAPWNHVLLVAWLRLVRSVDSPVWVEACWYPGAGVVLGTHHLEATDRKAADAHRNRAIKLLRAVEKRGRPLGTRRYTREEFHAAYPGADAQAERRRGRHRTDNDRARAMGVSDSTMKRYLREYGRPSLP
jgi:hypothetical protein